MGNDQQHVRTFGNGTQRVRPAGPAGTERQPAYAQGGRPVHRISNAVALKKKGAGQEKNDQKDKGYRQKLSIAPKISNGDDAMVTEPVHLGWGAFCWPIKFKLHPAPKKKGYLIQRVTNTLLVGKKSTSLKPPYFEAWEVEEGEENPVTMNADSGHDDEFARFFYHDASSGTIRKSGLAKYYPGSLKNLNFTVGGAKDEEGHSLAADLLSTMQMPYFWDNTGAVHEVIVTWDYPQHTFKTTGTEDEILESYWHCITHKSSHSSMQIINGKKKTPVPLVSDFNRWKRICKKLMADAGVKFGQGPAKK